MAVIFKLIFKYMIDNLEKEWQLKLQSLVSFIYYDKGKNVLVKLNPPQHPLSVNLIIKTYSKPQLKCKIIIFLKYRTLQCNVWTVQRHEKA